MRLLPDHLAELTSPAANGEVAMIWFGGGVSPQIVDDLYGVESVDELDIRMVRVS